MVSKKITFVSRLQNIVYLSAAFLTLLLYSGDGFYNAENRMLFGLAVVFGFLASMYVHIFIHEAGHMVFGWLTGYKFVSFKAFGIMWVKESGKIRLKKGVRVPGVGGQCLMSPPDMKNGKFPFVIYNLGGVIFNLIFGSAFLALYFLLWSHYYLSSVMLSLAVAGFYSAVSNGIPMTVGSVSNDGFNIIHLLKNRETVSAFWTQMKIMEYVTLGVRYSHIPEECFFIPSDNAPQNSITAGIWILYYNRLIDSGKTDEATELIDRLLSRDMGFGPLQRAVVIYDRIYLELVTGGNKWRVTELLSSSELTILKRVKNDVSIIRTDYSLALLYENNVNKAGLLLEQFNSVARHYPYKTDLEYEKNLIELAKMKNESQKAESNL